MTDLPEQHHDDETPAEDAAAPTAEQPSDTPPPTLPAEASPPTGPPPGSPPPVQQWPQQQSDSDRRNWAVGAHLSALVASTFTGLAVLGPLVVYLIKKDQDTFIAEHAREALNITIVTVGLGLIVFVPAAIAFFIAWIVFLIKASMAASRGEYYRYPLTVRLVS